MNENEFKKLLQKNLQMNLNKMTDYIFNSYDGLFVVDAEGRLVLANPAVLDMIGVPYDELMGNQVANIVSSGVYEGSPSMEAAKKHSVQTGLVKTRTGVEIMSTSQPVYDEEGKLKYVVTNCRPLSIIRDFFDSFMKNESDISAIRYDMKETTPDFVFTSPAMEKILKQLYYAAKTDCPIMLLGETGTGKSIMARLIHDNSLRYDNKFIELNCAALPENLIESELFGYEKGAFTGASESGKEGLLEIAHNGTIFLDEIGEMPIEIQAKLLKVLDTGYLMRIGGTVSRKVNVRVISATNRDLRQMMKENKFREDLLYRLNVVPVHIPSLKERLNELDNMIDYQLAKVNESWNVNKHFTDKARKAMKYYTWPGNIRQLENLIQRSVIMSMENDEINDLIVNHLIDEEKKFDMSEIPDDDAVRIDTSEPLRSFVDRVEIKYIVQCIRECGGSVTKAAEKMGIHRTAIYKKINAYEERTGEKVELM